MSRSNSQSCFQQRRPSAPTSSPNSAVRCRDRGPGTGSECSACRLRPTEWPRPRWRCVWKRSLSRSPGAPRPSRERYRQTHCGRERQPASSQPGEQQNPAEEITPTASQASNHSRYRRIPTTPTPRSHSRWTRRTGSGHGRPARRIMITWPSRHELKSAVECDGL
jgi:hypothetical protein